MQHQPFILTPTVFHILLALRDADRHGYQIMKQIEADTEGQIKLLTGTLYGALKRLLEEGLVAESSQRPDQDDARRRYYQLTPKGKSALGLELDRYKLALLVARKAQIYEFQS